jgi:hypothetical protein
MVKARNTRAPTRLAREEGHHGWDEYAPFYDWENARTFGRRDVPFWQRLVAARGGRVLELGSGTGRVTPLAKALPPAWLASTDPAAMLARTHLHASRATDNVSPSAATSATCPSPGALSTR